MPLSLQKLEENRIYIWQIVTLPSEKQTKLNWSSEVPTRSASPVGALPNTEISKVTEDSLSACHSPKLNMSSLRPSKLSDRV